MDYAWTRSLPPLSAKKEGFPKDFPWKRPSKLRKALKVLRQTERRIKTDQSVESLRNLGKHSKWTSDKSELIIVRSGRNGELRGAVIGSLRFVRLFGRDHLAAISRINGEFRALNRS